MPHLLPTNSLSLFLLSISLSPHLAPDNRVEYLLVPCFALALFFNYDFPYTERFSLSEARAESCFTLAAPLFT